MRVSADVKLGGIDESLKALNASLDVDDMVEEASAILLNRIRTRFLDEQGPAGKWIPSRAGLRRRAKGGSGTLFDTGKLFHSIQAHRLGAGEKSISTDVPYAKYHQFGTGQMHRPFLFFTEDDRDTVRALILHRIKAALK